MRVPQAAAAMLHRVLGIQVDSLCTYAPGATGLATLDLRFSADAPGQAVQHSPAGQSATTSRRLVSPGSAAL